MCVHAGPLTHQAINIRAYLQAHKPILHSIYAHYSALVAGKDRNLLDYPEWMELLSEAK